MRRKSGCPSKITPNKIKSFALVPVRGAPDAGDRRYARVVFIQHNLQAQPVIPSCREQVVVHFEARLFFGTAIEAAQVSQQIEVEARRRLQETAQLRLCAHAAR